MSKAETQSQSPTNTANESAHQVLNWAALRKLKKLEENYRYDLAKKPSEIESSAIGNPRLAAITYQVARLKQYARQFEGIYEAEIELGADRRHCRALGRGLPTGLAVCEGSKRTKEALGKHRQGQPQA